MSESAAKKVYTISAGIPFAKALAAQLLAENAAHPERLAEYRIFLPTRRACRTLREAFLQITAGRPLLLPRMQALGDIDEEELSLSLLAEGDMRQEIMQIPPAMPPLRRQLMLARLIGEMKEGGGGFDQAMKLAAALGRLMDQVHTEGLDLKDLHKIVPADFAAHWQITVEFMKILSEHWPRILLQEGAIDAAERRDRLIRALAGHWRQNPPAFPVIAAGSTGSIPATAMLLEVIAALPQGRIVLPGLDTEMEETDWNALDETHPQHGLKHLLAQIGLARETVKDWPADDHGISCARRKLAREMMRPAATSLRWTHLATSAEAQQTMLKSFENLKIFDCANETEEAETIAVMLREALETPGRTAALITPDRGLARRVAACCRRWDIALDDSAGRPLDKTPAGGFLLATLEACSSGLAPVALLGLLKHPFCTAGMKKSAFSTGVRELERLALRGPRPAPGFAGLKARLEEVQQKSTAAASETLAALEPALQQFLQLCDKNICDFNILLQTHLHMAEALAGGAEKLWQGEDGENAAIFLSDLAAHAALMPPMSVAAYAEILRTLMAGVTVRPDYGAHPRLHILGQLEARLVDADLIIMGGLNEGVWPPDPGHDPWMSRPMRRDFGLPGPERSIGLSAHDFTQAFCAPDVVITRSVRQGGAPATPARWLQRLETVLQAAGMVKTGLAAGPALSWARQLHRPERVTPASRPAPRPPQASRPMQLSVTQIETWLKDPYSIYARHILGLRKLDPLEQELDAALRGTLLHGILHRFLQAYPARLDSNARDRLITLAEEEIAARHYDPAVWNLWWPRFYRIADWLIDIETTRRETANPLGGEMEGRLTIVNGAGSFTLTARADRIDIAENTGLLIDYKSAGTYTKTALKNAESPQLPLEALILLRNGFASAKNVKPAAMSYWKMTGGEPAGEITTVDEDVETIARTAGEKLENLIARFADPETPYYSLPRPEKAPRFNDYEHLARVREWTVAGEDGDEAGEGMAA